MLTENFQMFKLDLEEAEELEIKLSTSVGSVKKQEFQKKVYFCFIDYAKVLTMWIKKTVENSSGDVNTRPSYLPPEKSACRSRSNI